LLDWFGDEVFLSVVVFVYFDCDGEVFFWMLVFGLVDVSFDFVYFDCFYVDGGFDFWGFMDCWYECCKCVISFVVLLCECFRCVFELGCLIGVFIEEFVDCCDYLFVIDFVIVVVEWVSECFCGWFGVEVC